MLVFDLLPIQLSIIALNSRKATMVRDKTGFLHRLCSLLRFIPFGAIDSVMTIVCKNAKKECFFFWLQLAFYLTGAILKKNFREYSCDGNTQKQAREWGRLNKKDKKWHT